jgi:uncharacterized protein (AIM24 family)
LRLNLAMVHLKTGKLDDAKIELERVLELNPDHPRATSYMGLVLERKGDLDRAASYYEKAGNKKRADEIRAYHPTQTGTFPLPNLQQMMQQAKEQAQRDAAVAPPASSTSAPSSSAAPPTTVVQRQPQLSPTPTVPPTPAPTIPPVAAIPSTPAPSTSRTPTQSMGSGAVPAENPADGAVHARQAEAAALTAATAAQLKRATEPPAPAAVDSARGASLGFTLEVDEKRTSTPPTGAAPSAQARPAPATPAAQPAPPAPPATAATPAPTTSSRLVESTLPQVIAAAITAEQPTLRDDGILAFPIPDVGYVRTDMLVALGGQFEIETVNRRYRGKRTDSLFGGPDAAIVAILGRGLALLHPDELAIRLVTLKSEELYLVEGALLAFTQGLVWENGRLPSETDRDLDIVHLRGSGRVVLGTKSPLLTLAVKPEAPVTVHASRLVGWNGPLVPYRAPLPGLPDVAKRIPVVRFEGTGVVLAV